MRYFKLQMSNLTIQASMILAAVGLLGAAATQVQAVDQAGRDQAGRNQVGRNQVGRSGKEPGWTYGVVRVGEEREQIKSLPMTERPYRPLHFYGNTVRRMHYRGTAVPAPRDLINAGAATIIRK